MILSNGTSLPSASSSLSFSEKEIIEALCEYAAKRNFVFSKGGEQRVVVIYPDRHNEKLQLRMYREGSIEPLIKEEEQC